MTAWKFCTHVGVTATIGVTQECLKDERLRGDLVLGIHWFRRSKTAPVLYNLPLLVDKLVNTERPDLHEIAIQNFLASLPSSAPRKGLDQSSGLSGLPQGACAAASKKTAKQSEPGKNSPTKSSMQRSSKSSNRAAA
jgi:hypothetical protein